MLSRHLGVGVLAPGDLTGGSLVSKPRLRRVVATNVVHGGAPAAPFAMSNTRIIHLQCFWCCQCFSAVICQHVLFRADWSGRDPKHVVRGNSEDPACYVCNTLVIDGPLFSPNIDMLNDFPRKPAQN